MTWLLVLALYAQDGSGVPAVLTVPGFPSMDECQRSGEAVAGGLYGRWACLPTGPWHEPRAEAPVIDDGNRILLPGTLTCTSGLPVACH